MTQTGMTVLKNWKEYFLIIKPTRCTNFSNVFLEYISTCFGQFLCPSSGVFHCTHSNGVCHTGLLTACEQDQDGRPDPASTAVMIYFNIYQHLQDGTTKKKSQESLCRGRDSTLEPSEYE